MIGENSRYRRGIVTLSFDQAGNPTRKPWIDRIPARERLPLRGLRQYTVVEGDTWFNLASRLYGDSKLWFVIAEQNGVIDPFSTLTPGASIALPSRDVVFFELLDFEAPDFQEGPL